MIISCKIRLVSWTDKTWSHSSAGRASALQAGGHRFEPYCDHHIGPVVQLVRTLACHARGRRFEPVPGRQKLSSYLDSFNFIRLDSSVGRAGDWKSPCQWFDSTSSHHWKIAVWISTAIFYLFYFH